MMSQRPRRAPSRRSPKIYYGSQKSPKDELWTLDLDKVDPTNTDHLVELNIQGMSFMKMETLLGVPHSTAHSRVSAALKKRAHNPFNLAKVIRSDYLNSKNYSIKQKAEISLWLAKYHRELASIPGKYYSESQEQDITTRETSPIRDWSSDIE